MVELKHFSHEKHPLILTQVEHCEAEESNCYGCQKPIFSEPAYTCKECNIFLHKKCAELPIAITHPLHPEHPLKLHSKPPYRQVEDKRCFCDACKQEWKSFVYHCFLCQFDLDILCAFPDERLDHLGHEHPLTLLQRLALFTCDACGTKGEEQSYICVACPLWIHRSCALLPRIDHRKGHDHPLSLAYCLPIEYRRYEIPCDVCFRKIQLQNWVYYCGPCRYFVHLKCMTRERFVPRDKHILQLKDDERKDLVQLPDNNFAEVIRLVLEKQQGMEILKFPNIMKVSCCGHPFTILDIQNYPHSKNYEEITCNRCTESINSWCCKCTQCNYFVHPTCAQLPVELQHPSHHEHKLKLAFLSYIWGKRKCQACNTDCNGYFFWCGKCPYYCFDVKCALLPSTIAHKAHEHPLIQIYRGDNNKCNSCGKFVGSPLFACEPCRFYLDYECALLPETIYHRWDKHRLLLSFPPFSDRPDEFYCEICEEEVHPRRWHYHCRECDQSFHPRCIPRLGESRNCSFGRIHLADIRPSQVDW
ncbi:hypothetical protein ACH5RR_007340 [Cinchona calisaya]|uniref:Phorbol-ester/DAG-type domain-containing protein n=1 Tax=Cinchona calisaya TaxID=153742 RepID=A0ABD3ARI4_9GENT